jgi:hypothetical protein
VKLSAGTLTDVHLAALENETDKLITVQSAASGLGLTPIAVRQWVYRHNLPHAFIDGRLHILASAIYACLQDRRHAGGGKPRRSATQPSSRLVTSSRPE